MMDIREAIARSLHNQITLESELALSKFEFELFFVRQQEFLSKYNPQDENQNI